MDPSTWGPKLWSFIFDVCWNIDKVELNKQDKFAVNVFFNSLKYVMPCKHCRDSYCKYLKELGGAPQCKVALEWAYALKNKVNDKLNTRDRIIYEKLVQRMKTYQSCASQSDVLDFLFIVGVNYMADKDDSVAHTRKKAWFWLMIRTLPIILMRLPEQQQLAEALSEKTAQREDVQNKDTVILYLCEVSQRVDGRSRNVEKMCKKYLHAQNRSALPSSPR